ncbi:MAG: DUF3108 domain-containing protein [Bacteroidales bacterium]|nr:DUF3108 domain-containing protein [Bacteroidales bacterium]
MKRILISVAMLIILSGNVHSQELRVWKNEAFGKGEKITYRAYYDSFLTGNVNAGEASLEIQRESKVVAGRNTMHVVGLGKTKGLFNLFFKVVNRYETFIDERAIVPLLFIRRTDEGGYKISQDVTFNQYTHKAISNTATVNVVENVQDIISAFYYARTMDASHLSVGDEIPINFFLDDSVYVTKIIYEGVENVNIRLGTFRCLRFKPMVLTGTVFKQPYPMTLWISDDKNKIPVLAQSGILVGSVKLELMKYSGLRNPLTSKIR